jgi:outer membrane protein TolC
MVRKILTSIAVFTPVLLSAHTLESIVDLAYSNSINKIEQQEKIKKLEYQKEVYLSNEPLFLESNIRNIRANDVINNGNEYSAMVGTSFKNPMVKKSQIQEYTAEAKILNIESDISKKLLEISIKNIYLQATLDNEIAQIYKFKIDTAKKALEAAKAKKGMGRISSMELSRFEIDYTVAQQEASIAKHAYEEKQNTLRNLLLINEDIILDDVTFCFIHDSSFEDGLNSSIFSELYNAKKESLAKQMQILRDSKVEYINVGVGMTQEVTQKSIDFKLSLPLAWGDKNEKKIAALMTQQSSINQQKELFRKRVLHYVDQALSHLKEIQYMVSESQEIEKKNKALYEMSCKGYEGGIVSLFEYLETRNRYYSASIETVKMKQMYVEELAKLEEETGRIWK